REPQAAAPQGMPDAVRPDGVQTGVEHSNLEVAARGGVPPARSRDVLARTGDDAHVVRSVLRLLARRVAQVLEPGGGDVALTRVGEDHHDGPARVLRTFGDLQR